MGWPTKNRHGLTTKVCVGGYSGMLNVFGKRSIKRRRLGPTFSMSTKSMKGGGAAEDTDHIQMDNEHLMQLFSKWGTYGVHRLQILSFEKGILGILGEN